MPVAPSQPIQGISPWTPFDTSGVCFDATKLASMPASLYEDGEGYRERITEHGWEVERSYKCNWSDVAAAMQWFYGYSYTDIQRTLNDKCPSFTGALPNGSAFTAPPGGIVGTMHRVIPAQDPYRPYLYADQVELAEPIGVPLQDPELFLTNIDGTPITQNGTLILPAAPGPVVPLPGPPEWGVGPSPANQPPQADPLGRVKLPGLWIAESRGYSGTRPVDGTPLAFSDGAAKLRVTFRQRPYVIRNDGQNNIWGQGEIGRYVEREPNYAIQGVPLYQIQSATGQLKFSAGPFAGNAIPEAGVMLIPTQSWKYTWHDVPFYPAQAIANIVGRVNSDTFDGIAGFPPFTPGTLLCQSPSIEWRRNACGQIAFKITWTLDARIPFGWNTFPAQDGNFYPATWGGGAPRADGSNLVFKPAAFASLFAIDNTFPFL